MEDNRSDCIFCKIVSGDIPSSKIYEDDQVIAFEAEGWDVTDDKRRPLRMFEHFAPQLWLALRGVAGELPFQAEADPDEAVYSSLAADAAKFRRDRR